MGDKQFKRFVNYFEIDDNDVDKGMLWVTMSDEKPWLCIAIDDEESSARVVLALEPELASYWLGKIKKFYGTSVESTKGENDE